MGKCKRQLIGFQKERGREPVRRGFDHLDSVEPNCKNLWKSSKTIGVMEADEQPLKAWTGQGLGQKGKHAAVSSESLIIPSGTQTRLRKGDILLFILSEKLKHSIEHEQQVPWQRLYARCVHLIFWDTSLCLVFRAILIQDKLNQIGWLEEKRNGLVERAGTLMAWNGASYGKVWSW